MFRREVTVCDFSGNPASAPDFFCKIPGSSNLKTIQSFRALAWSSYLIWSIGIGALFTSDIFKANYFQHVLRRRSPATCDPNLKIRKIFLWAPTRGQNGFVTTPPVHIFYFHQSGTWFLWNTNSPEKQRVSSDFLAMTLYSVIGPTVQHAGIWRARRTYKRTFCKYITDDFDISISSNKMLSGWPNKNFKRTVGPHAYMFSLHNRTKIIGWWFAEKSFWKSKEFLRLKLLSSSAV